MHLAPASCVVGDGNVLEARERTGRQRAPLGGVALALQVTGPVASAGPTGTPERNRHLFLHAYLCWLSQRNLLTRPRKHTDSIITISDYAYHVSMARLCPLSDASSRSAVFLAC